MFRLASPLSILALVLCLAACDDKPTEEDVGPAALDTDSEPEDADESTDIDVPVQFDAGPGPVGELAEHCAEVIGPAEVVELAEGLFVARGYDLSNTILIVTSDGNVVVDVSTSPARAAEVKDALMELAPGPTLAIIYTHSHVDHIGGASVWAEEGTQIWATDAFMPHLIKQYGAFRGAESRRGELQFGQHVDQALLACSALGKPVDVAAALQTGVRKPTHTFSGTQSLEFGGVTLELVEAHGETHDQLFVYLPALEALLCGDNYYEAFPNLYTIRGTSPRPVDAWIASLDTMRALEPWLLVPSHTREIAGKEAVQAALTDYRDAIQWVRDEVVRGANALEDLDSMAQRIQLPAHLVSQPALKPLYGQVDWSVRGIYGSNLGWFDGRADRLYPPDDVAAREIQLMGGAAAVMEAATQALSDGDAKWATHLMGKVRDSGLMEASALDPALAEAYQALGEMVQNSNGRAYLLESAWRLQNDAPELASPTLDEAFIDAIPVKVFFEVMQTRLKPETALDVHESVVFHISDPDMDYVMTVRRGVAELVVGTPLPGTPAPISEVEVTAATWRRLSLGLIEQLQAVASGELVATDFLALATFVGRFEQGL